MRVHVLLLQARVQLCQRLLGFVLLHNELLLRVGQRLHSLQVQRNLRIVQDVHGRCVR